MDAYGCCKIEDARDLASKLFKMGSIVFAYAYNDHAGAAIIEMSIPTVIGTMPYGGSPRGRIWVSVYGHGCNHFSQESIHPGYFKEKLSLGQFEADQLSKLWDAMWSEDLEKQS